MSITNRNSINVLKWLFFIPIGITIYLLSNGIISYFVFQFDQTFALHTIYGNGFGKYRIIGPLFIFLREVNNVAIATYYGIYLAPKHKKTIFKIMFVFWILVIAVNLIVRFNEYSLNEYSLDKMYRTIIEIIAEIVGFLIARYYIWKKQDPIKQDPINEHLKPFKDSFTIEQKAAILGSLAIIAKIADDNIKKNEMKVIELAAKVLGMNLYDPIIIQIVKEDPIYIKTVLNTLDRHQKEWYVIMVNDLVISDDKMKNIKISLADYMLEAIGISDEEFDRIINKSNLQTKMFSK